MFGRVVDHGLIMLVRDVEQMSSTFDLAGTFNLSPKAYDSYST